MLRRHILALGLCLPLLTHCSRKEPESLSEAPLRVAVASNFASVMEGLAPQFQKESGYKLEISAGSTGKLYAQIENGAPFDVFLSADAERPLELERSGKALPGSRFTYAFGRLALYGPAVQHPEDGAVDLRAGNFKHLSCANSKTAPYGVAAQQILERLGLWATLEPRVVRGENITQTHQFVDTGAAEVGLVALSSVIKGGKHKFWIVPESLHQPIRQDAVQLRRDPQHPGAAALMKFLKASYARERVEGAGYGAETS